MPEITPENFEEFLHKLKDSDPKPFEEMTVVVPAPLYKELALCYSKIHGGDYVKVTRCENCRYCIPDVLDRTYGVCGTCVLDMREVTTQYFCGDGKPKMEDMCDDNQ